MRLEFVLNSEPIFMSIEPSMTLATLLRRRLALQSLHETCKGGFCGQCVVLVNNQSLPSCLTPAYRVHGCVVQTIEGLSTEESFADIEKGLLTVNLNPCPYCAGNKAVFAESILRLNVELTIEKVYSHLPNYWCPCSSIHDFAQGVLAAHKLRYKKDRRYG